MFEVLSRETWNLGLREEAIYVCQLPFSVLEVEERLGTAFHQYESNGLGTLFSLFLKSHDVTVWLRGFGDKSQVTEPVAVYTYSYHDQSSVVAAMLQLFKLKHTELIEVPCK
jgi:hypothetical protein